MKTLDGKKVVLNDGELKQKENSNREYMMELDSEALLQNYYLEAGIGQVFGGKVMRHTGWEDPSCQLRGHFLGHYLSAAAMKVYETGDKEMLAKAETIVHELRLCQIENGGLWAASIPEKYFTWIARGKAVWAPHYTVHKTFMGLIDMYKYTGCEEALTVALDFAKWFYEFTNDKTKDEMDDILDYETGGMLEVWADLFEITKDPMFRKLIDRYDRRRLFDPLLEGVDVLTNMHANTTIPEALGCARVYEATGDERYKKIAMAYWDMAVTKRGGFVTGGQTMGEIWTPMHSMAPRLGEKNQEHCTVYNMMRLADILFKWTGDPVYLDYIERNLHNGIMAQGYFRGGHTNGQTPEYPEEGLITYFLPLFAGGRKGWGSKRGDFFCCHGTLVQANAAHNKYLYYQNDNNIYTGVYADSEVSFTVGNKDVKLSQRRDSLSGSFHSSSTSSAGQGIDEKTHIYLHQPDLMVKIFKVECDGTANWTLNLRKPEWVKKQPALSINDVEVKLVSGDVIVNGEKVSIDVKEDGFIAINKDWANDDKVVFEMPMSVYCTKLEGSDNMYAYSYGPIVLAGLCSEERILYARGTEKEQLIVHDAEREWGSWKNTFKTVHQDRGFKLVPLNQIGYERYQVYFEIEE